MADSISDMIIQMKNAVRAGKPSLVVPFSKLKMAIAETLVKEGFLKSISKKGKKVIKSLELELAYIGKTPKVHDVIRISKLSKRIYQKAKNIRSVRQGYGKLILSTPKGIMTDREAKKNNVGGEALFKIW